MLKYDLINYAKSLSNKEIDELIADFSKIKDDRAGDARRAAAKKVIEAIKDYLALGEDIIITGGVWNEEWNTHDNVESTLTSFIEDDGYLEFTFAD